MIHLVKLSVGSKSVESLAGWQAGSDCVRVGECPAHITRMWPKRQEDLLDGGSIYWVIQGQMQARQRIKDLVEHRGTDGLRRCAIVLDPQLVRVAPSTKRPFQGWRYLAADEAPRDLGPLGDNRAQLPPELDAALAEIGVI